jgi:hypothetical protein
MKGSEDYTLTRGGRPSQNSLLEGGGSNWEGLNWSSAISSKWHATPLERHNPVERLT